MRYPITPRRSKSQDSFRADRASTAPMLSLKLAPNMTGNVLTVSHPNLQPQIPPNTNATASFADVLAIGPLVWNNANTFYTALKINVNDIASSSSSALLDLRISSGVNPTSSASVVSIRKDGTIFLNQFGSAFINASTYTGTATNATNADQAEYLYGWFSIGEGDCYMNSYNLWLDGGSYSYLYADGGGNMQISTNDGGSGGILSLSASATQVNSSLTVMSGYGLVLLGTSTGSNGIFVNNTWNNSGTSYAAFKTNIIDTASAFDSKLADLQVGSVTKMSVDKRGVIFSTTPQQQIYQALNFGGF